MCTDIAERTTVAGSAKGPAGWFPLSQSYVSYDHPTHVQLEHAVLLDFVDEEAGPTARVAVELDRRSARALAEGILRALERAGDYEGDGPA